MKKKFFETKTLEFKREYTDSILKTVCAFANYEGGKIIIGYDEEKGIIGVNDFVNEKLRIENKINDSINPMPDYEIKLLEIENKIIIELNVFSGDNTPYLYKGISYKRNDTSTIPINQLGLKYLALKGSNLTFDKLKISNKDLNFSIFEKYFKKVKKSISKINKSILITLDLFDGENYNNAAELISDNNSIETSSIDLVRFGNDNSSFVERKTIEKTSIINQFDEAIKFLDKNYPEIEVVEGVTRIKKYSIPKEAYREAVASAIVHRDYLQKGKIQISMYDNRIEILSPGGLPEGMTEELYQNDQISIPRNPLIANIFFMLKFIEKFGTGVARINKSYLKNQLKPKYVILDNYIKIILPNMLFNDKDMLPEKRIINLLEIKVEISRIDVENYLNVNKTSAIKIINEMIKKDIIKTIGEGKNTLYKLCI